MFLSQNLYRFIEVFYYLQIYLSFHLAVGFTTPLFNLRLRPFPLTQIDHGLNLTTHL